MSRDGKQDPHLARVTSELRQALTAKAELSRYDPAQHEAQLLELLWEPILERDPLATVRSDATRAGLSRALESSSELVMVAQQGGEVVGALWLRADGPASRPTLHVAELVLRPEWRSAGRGSHIMRALDASAAEAGVEGISLNFMADNARVEPFYSRLGYEVAGYDLRKPAEVRVSPAGSDETWAYRPEHDAQLVAQALRQERSRHPFSHVRAGVEEELAALVAAAGAGSAFVRLVRAEPDAPVGFIWYELTRSSLSGRHIVDLRALVVGGSQPQGGLLALLSSADAHAQAEGHTADAFLTLIRPSDAALHTLINAGFAVGRKKLFKTL